MSKLNDALTRHEEPFANDEFGERADEQDQLIQMDDEMNEEEPV